MEGYSILERYEDELNIALDKIDMDLYLEMAKLHISEMEDEYNDVYTEDFSPEPRKGIYEIMAEACDKANDATVEYIKKVQEEMKKNTPSDLPPGGRDAKVESGINQVRKVLDKNVEESIRLMDALPRDKNGKIKEEAIDKFIEDSRKELKDRTKALDGICRTAGTFYGSMAAQNERDDYTGKLKRALKKSKEDGKKLREDPEARKKASLLQKLSSHVSWANKEVVDNLFNLQKEAYFGFDEARDKAERKTEKKFEKQMKKQMKKEMRGK